MTEPIIRFVRTPWARRTSRISLILLTTALAASGAAVAAPMGFLRVAVEHDSVVFALSEPGPESISVRILDGTSTEVLNIGPVSGGEVIWDLNEAALDGIEDGIFLYEVLFHNLEGEIEHREMGLFVAAPQSRDPHRLTADASFSI